MPIPAFTYPITGPLIDLSGMGVAATQAMRDNGVVYISDSGVHRVNADGDAWEPIPGWIVSDTEPTVTFEGMGWFDTNV